MVVVSVLVALVPKLGPFVEFAPLHFLFTPWTALTYGFVANDPIGVIFGVLIMLGLGAALERQWGSRRFVVFSLGVTAAGAVATWLVSLVWARVSLSAYGGSTVMTGALWVAYGLAVGAGQSNFWGLPVTGNQLALIGVAFVALNAAFSSIVVVMPSAFALAFTYLASRGYSPTNAWLAFRSWQLTRQLNRRSNRLKVISGEKRNMPNDSDRYLH